MENGSVAGTDSTMVRCPKELWERVQRLAVDLTQSLPPGVAGPSAASVCRTAIERGCEVLEKDLGQERRRSGLHRKK
jgi:hypothetical protein